MNFKIVSPANEGVSSGNKDDIILTNVEKCRKSTWVVVEVERRCVENDPDVAGLTRSVRHASNWSPCDHVDRENYWPMAMFNKRQLSFFGTTIIFRHHSELFPLSILCPFETWF